MGQSRKRLIPNEKHNYINLLVSRKSIKTVVVAFLILAIFSGLNLGMATTVQHNINKDATPVLVNDSFDDNDLYNSLDEMNRGGQVNTDNSHKKNLFDLKSTVNMDQGRFPKNGLKAMTMDLPRGVNLSLVIPSGEDSEGMDIVVATNGDTYVVGTAGYGVPVLNAYDSTFNGDYDGYIAKFSSTGQLIWSTYFGGSGEDWVKAVSLDNNNNLYIVGFTSSPDFPTLSPYDATYNGIEDSFIAKFSSSGQLLWSTYFGGNDTDMAYDVEIDSDGNIYITGFTYSRDFPVLNAYDNTKDDSFDAFVAKFSPNYELLWSTFLGGNDWDFGIDLAVNIHKDVFIIGDTDSNDFPTTANAFNRTFGGLTDVFVTKLDTNGQLIWSTFLGASDVEEGFSITTFNSDVYVTGYTESPNFPTLNAFDDSHNGGRDIFVSKINNNTGQLVWSTFYGGSFNDYATSIVVDNQGVIHLSGYTFSDDFQLFNPYDATYNGACDAFLANLNSDGQFTWSTYIGGEGEDRAYDVWVDGNGNSYAAGTSSSIDFPTKNAYDPTYNGGFSAIIMKFNSNYSLEWSTFFGGGGDDDGYSIAHDSHGNAYIAGDTNSANIPIKNAFDDTYNSKSDVFVMKVSPSGEILWSTFFGGSGDDFLMDVTVDSEGNVYITGYTDSNDFPTLNGRDASFNGGYDAFVAKFNTDGQLLWSTFLGDTYSDYGDAITVDIYGNVYVTGSTTSSNFPILNAYDSTYDGGFDAFVAKYNSNGELLWSTFLGGDSDEIGYGIIVNNAANETYIAGYTSSSDFPVSNKTFDNSSNGQADGFIAKFTSDGHFLWGTFFGGSKWDMAYGIGIDKNDNVYIAGLTYSNDLPMVNSYDNKFSYDTDAFLAKFNKTGSLIWSTYFGGINYDKCYDIAVDENGNSYIVGTTTSSEDDFFPLKNAFDGTYENYGDAFVASFSTDGKLVWSSFLGGYEEDVGFGISVDKNKNVYVTGYTKSSDFPQPHNNNTYSFSVRKHAFLTILSSTYFIDSDGDGMPDGWEIDNGLNPNNSSDANIDNDGDGLTNLQEYQHSTNPNNSDTDGDGMPDGWEVEHDLDPLRDDANEDPDNDGFTNLEEYRNGTDPHHPDSTTTSTSSSTTSTSTSSSNTTEPTETTKQEITTEEGGFLDYEFVIGLVALLSIAITVKIKRKP